MLDPAALIQLLTGQPPLIVLIVLLLIQNQRQNDAALKAERQYGEALKRERDERTKFTDETLERLLKTTEERSVAMTRFTEELHDLKNAFQREIVERGRERRAGDD